MTQTVLVTGATGFLGSHLVRRLLQEGYRVVILKRSFSNTWRIDEILQKLICYDIDKCDLAQPFLDVGKIDAVVHTATTYGKNNEKPSAIIESNVLLPLQILELAINFQSSFFINTDTYFNKTLNSYEYLSYYCLSKRQIGEWFHAIKGKIKFCNIILEHIFGPQDAENKFTTYAINQCLADAEYLDLTPGNQMRDFIYVDDVTAAYVSILKTGSDEIYQEYQVGSGNPLSIREFMEKIKHFSGSKTELRFGAIPYRNQEIMSSYANLDALTQLGWAPQYSIDHALQKTINWYQNHSIFND
ncbi:MAG: NAD-dependent epimerase/dehydratase [Oscillatoriaceae cyanobacterium]